MSNWKKLIYSGSDAEFKSVATSDTIISAGNVTAPLFIGNLRGNADTATDATYADTASVANRLSNGFIWNSNSRSFNATVVTASADVYVTGSIKMVSGTLSIPGFPDVSKSLNDAIDGIAQAAVAQTVNITDTGDDNDVVHYITAVPEIADGQSVAAHNKLSWHPSQSMLTITADAADPFFKMPSLEIRGEANSEGAAMLFVGSDSSSGGGIAFQGSTAVTDPSKVKVSNGPTTTPDNWISLTRRKDGADEFVAGYHLRNTGFYFRDDIGIGVESPDRKLHIQGDTNTVAAKIEATDSSQASIDLKNSDGDYRLLTEASKFHIYDQTTEANKLTINANGNVSISGSVGIGTSDPEAALHVKKIPADNGITNLLILDGFGSDNQTSAREIAMEFRGGDINNAESGSIRLSYLGDTYYYLHPETGSFETDDHIGAGENQFNLHIEPDVRKPWLIGETYATGDRSAIADTGPYEGLDPSNYKGNTVSQSPGKRFIYTEASGQFGKLFTLRTPAINLNRETSNEKLVLYFHAHGYEFDDQNDVLEISHGEAFYPNDVSRQLDYKFYDPTQNVNELIDGPINGPTPNAQDEYSPFYRLECDISSLKTTYDGSFFLYITSTTGPKYQSDLAIDNIHVVGELLPGMGNLIFANTYNNVMQDRMIITGDHGRVGIGTNFPNSKLQVVGNSNGLPLLSIKNTGSMIDDDVFMSFNRDNDNSLGYSIGINSFDDSFNIGATGNSISTAPRFTINSSGDVGIGTVNPSQKLDITGNVAVDGHKILDLSNNNSSRGPFNPIVSALRNSGKCLKLDTDFNDGVNGVYAYNTHDNDHVTITRHGWNDLIDSSIGPVTLQEIYKNLYPWMVERGAATYINSNGMQISSSLGVPNSSGHVLLIKFDNSGDASTVDPGLGGFKQLFSNPNYKEYDTVNEAEAAAVTTQMNHTYVQVFKALLPENYKLNAKNNAQGADATTYFLTDSHGTGKWEWYACVTHVGSEDHQYSSAGFIYITPSDGTTTYDTSIGWFLASCAVYDMTEADAFTHRRIGVGTSRPQSDLHVVGNISASSADIEGTLNVDGDIGIGGSIFGLSGFGVTIDDVAITSGSTNFGSGSNPAETMHSRTGSMSITGSTFTFNGERVITNSDPVNLDYSLHVAGDITASALSIRPGFPSATPIIDFTYSQSVADGGLFDYFPHLEFGGGTAYIGRVDNKYNGLPAHGIALGTLSEGYKLQLGSIAGTGLNGITIGDSQFSNESGQRIQYKSPDHAFMNTSTAHPTGVPALRITESKAFFRSDVQISGSLYVSESVVAKSFTGSLEGTASYAAVAEHALNAINPFPFTGRAVITGSLVMRNAQLPLASVTDVDNLVSVTDGYTFGGTPDNIFDGDENWSSGFGGIYWTPEDFNANSPIDVDYNIAGRLGYAPVIDKIRVIQLYNFSSPSVQISGSNDGINWTGIYRTTDIPKPPSSPLPPRTVIFDNTTAYNHYRARFHEIHEGVSGLMINEIEYFERGIIESNRFIGTASSAVSASYVVSASYAISASYADFAPSHLWHDGSHPIFNTPEVTSSRLVRIQNATPQLVLQNMQGQISDDTQHLWSEIRFTDSADNTTAQIRTFDGSDRYFEFAGKAMPLALSTAGTKALVVTGSSHGPKIGIGSTSPTKNLHVFWNHFEADIQTGNTLSGGGSGYGMLIENDSNTIGAYANLDFRAGDADGRIALQKSANNSGDFHFITDDGANENLQTRLFITASGNVGIGTIKPDKKLVVAGDISASAGLYVKGLVSAADNTHMVVTVDPATGQFYYDGAYEDAGDNVQADITNLAEYISHIGDSDTKFGFRTTNEFNIFTAGAERVRVEQDGDLHVAKDIIARSSTPSDLRLKTNIHNITSSLSQVCKLQGVYYDWKSREAISQPGLIAQEVEKIFPNIIKEQQLPFYANDNELYKTIRYEQLIPYLIESIKELKSELDQVKRQLKQ